MFPPPIIAEGGLPGEQAVMSALEANVINVALVAVLLSIICVICIVLIGFNLVKGILASLKQQIDSNTRQAEANAESNRHIGDMVNQLKDGQRVQSDQTQAIREAHKAVDKHEEKTEERYQLLMEGLKGVSSALPNQFTTLKTDLVGDIGKRIEAAVAPLLTDLGALRTSIEETQTRHNTEMEALAGQGTRIQQEFLHAIRKTVEEVREQANVVQVPAVAGDSGGDAVSAADDGGSGGNSDSSSSAGDSDGPVPVSG